MKTDLTLEIEKALTTYRPAYMGGCKISLARARHMAFEVPVVCGTSDGGLIDSVEVAEYMIDRQSFYTCCWGFSKKAFDDSVTERHPCTKKLCQVRNDGCDEKGCKWNHQGYAQQDEILTICYEVKISKADFRNKNGHNFVGNLNYYVMPMELYKSVKDLIPPDIGVIAYLTNIKSPYAPRLRKQKECEYRDIGDEAQKWLILSVLKRMRKTGTL